MQCYFVARHAVRAGRVREDLVCLMLERRTSGRIADDVLILNGLDDLGHREILEDLGIAAPW